MANAPVRAQTSEQRECSYRRETMEQVAQTKARFQLYGLRFDSDSATVQRDSEIFYSPTGDPVLATTLVKCPL